MDRVLLIQLRQVGDVILATPIARIIKEAWPQVRLSFLTEAPNDQILAHNPYIDAVILTRRKAGVRETLATIRALRRQRFDAVLDFMANPRSAQLAFGSGAPVRISYPKRFRGRLYTHQVAPTEGYAVAYKKSLLKPLGISSDRLKPELFLTAEERRWGQAFCKELSPQHKRRLVTIDPTHRRITRCWPAEHYGKLCGLLAERLDVLPLILWGPGELPVAEAVASYSEGRAIVAPPTDLRQSMAVIAAADAHLGNCSSPRHVAVAVDTPSFVVLGSTSRAWEFPTADHISVQRGVDCQPCNRNHCDIGIICLTEYGPEAVFETFAAWSTERLGWIP